LGTKELFGRIFPLHERPTPQLRLWPTRGSVARELNSKNQAAGLGVLKDIGNQVWFGSAD